ncbi:fasciclin domain-containing protein [Flavobacterium sp. FZUC8N2.13]|uniref:Fasciclin domain-containing protein n=1 Tax=Flavobacterium zubiriense TaxID=3138075 RepID=A0ABV4T8U3_9FLAO
MIKFHSFYKNIAVAVLMLIAFSCSDPWNDRNTANEANIDKSLAEAISSSSEFSEFSKVLVATGYDKVLASSKNFTVFVPSNAAMSQVPVSIINDPVALKQFVGNHIALTSFSSVRDTDEVQIEMQSKKFLMLKGSATIDDATIIKADMLASNGIYHIIDKPLTPKLNIWQFVASQSETSMMSADLLALKEFNIYQADSVKKALSESVGAGFLSDSLTNSFLTNVYNLNNEKNSYTLFLMENDGYTEETDKMKAYTIKSTTDSTATYAKYFTVRDMVFNKKYEPSELPSTLTSRFGVEYDVDKTQIVGEPIRLSNGIVYIMKKVDVPLAKRLVPIVIQGESFDIRYNMSNSIASIIRDFFLPSAENINDVFVLNPGSALPRLVYQNRLKDLYSTTYRVHWRAINNKTTVFSQTISIGGNYVVTGSTFTFVNPLKTLIYTPVPINNFNEVFVGDFTPLQSGNILNLTLLGANTATNGQNSLALDYLKIVPVVK